MTAEALISGSPIACLFAGLLAVGAFLALLVCCRIAELEKAESQPATAPSVKGMAPEASGASGGSGWDRAGGLKAICRIHQGLRHWRRQ